MVTSQINANPRTVPIELLNKKKPRKTETATLELNAPNATSAELNPAPNIVPIISKNPAVHLTRKGRYFLASPTATPPGRAVGSANKVAPRRLIRIPPPTRATPRAYHGPRTRP